MIIQKYKINERDNNTSTLNNKQNKKKILIYKFGY